MASISAKTRERYKALILPHVKFLYRVAYHYSKNSYDAEDLVQEACYLALKNLHQLREDAMAKAWLSRILRNAFLRTLRPSKQLQVEEWAGEGPDDIWKAGPMGDASSHTQRDLILKLVEGLQEHYKSALLLHTIGDMTYEQIAQILDVPIGTVMSRISRAKRLLQKKLQAMENRPKLQVVPGGKEPRAAVTSPE